MKSLLYETRVLKYKGILSVIGRFCKDTTDTVTTSSWWMLHYQIMIGAKEMCS